MSKLILTILMVFMLTFLNAQIIWDDQINIGPSSAGNHHPRIVLDASGNPLVVWTNHDRLMYSRWNGTSFETPKSLNPPGMNIAGASWMGPQIAAHGDTVYIVFKEIPEDSKFSWAIHSYDGGLNFSDPVQIDFIGDSLSRFPTVTTDAEGHPVVAFMKFNSSFGDARWVVTRSDDHGKSFSSDVLASNWSDPDADVCDCCPGTIVSHDHNVVMLYRDNNNNKRDSWAGISRDGGNTFSQGANIDQQNWMISSCPASGPDGVIIGDTLYTTFMNGASGKIRVYTNKVSLSDFNPEPAQLITGDLFGLSSQNFPRIASYGNAASIVWKQQISGQEQLVMHFYNDIASGLEPLYDTVDLNQIMNADVAMSEDRIFVVWEDYNSGTVRFRAGEYEGRTSLDDFQKIETLHVFPNPSTGSWILSGYPDNSSGELHLRTLDGTLIRTFTLSGEKKFKITQDGLKEGMYILSGIISGKNFLAKLVRM